MRDMGEGRRFIFEKFRQQRAAHNVCGYLSCAPRRGGPRIWLCSRSAGGCGREDCGSISRAADAADGVREIGVLGFWVWMGSRVDELREICFAVIIARHAAHGLRAMTREWELSFFFSFFFFRES